jgi:hypothetical protein
MMVMVMVMVMVMNAQEIVNWMMMHEKNEHPLFPSLKKCRCRQTWLLESESHTHNSHNKRWQAKVRRVAMTQNK